MGNQSNQENDIKLNLNLKNRDWIFLGAVLLLAAAGILWFFLGYSSPGSRVEVTVDGEITGVYPLAEPREVPLPSRENPSNRLVIADGQARMEWADCPDQICVEHAAVSHEGEEIVCLPNRILVRVVGGEDGRMDAVAR